MIRTGKVALAIGSARPERRHHPLALAAAAMACQALLFACAGEDLDPEDHAPTAGVVEEPASCLELLSVLDGPRDYVYSVNWSPVNDYVLVGSNEELRLVAVDMQAAKLAVVDTHAAHPKFSSVRWSADGKYAITVGGEVQLFAVQRRPPRLDLLATHSAHQGDVYSVDWSPDGKHVLTGGRDKTVRLIAVDPARRVLSERAIFYGHLDWVLGLDWAADGRHAVSVGNDGSVRLLAVDLDAVPFPDLRELARGDGGDEQSAASWTPKGDMVLTGSWALRHSVQVWSVNTEVGTLELFDEFTNHLSGVGTLEWTRDGERIATAGHDDTVRLSRFADGEMTDFGFLGDYASGVHSVSWSRDELYMVMAASRADRIALVSACDCLRLAGLPIGDP